MATTSTKEPLGPNVCHSTPISIQQQQSCIMMSSSIETTCLSTHYALNKHIHAAFEAHHHQTHRNRHGGNSSLVAYYFGLKYLEIALLEIPQHASFYSLDKTFAHLRRESTINALQVCHVLHEIIANEPQMLGKESRKIEILHGLAMEQFENLSNYENARKRAVDPLKKTYPSPECNVS